MPEFLLAHLGIPFLAGPFYDFFGVLALTVTLMVFYAGFTGSAQKV
jgi:hypothetical protein